MEFGTAREGDCMYVAPSTLQKARKAHACTWCEEEIAAGERYERWLSIDRKAYTNKMHIECANACHENSFDYDGTYTPFDNVRGEA